MQAWLLILRSIVTFFLLFSPGAWASVEEDPLAQRLLLEALKKLSLGEDSDLTMEFEGKYFFACPMAIEGCSTLDPCSIPPEDLIALKLGKEKAAEFGRILRDTFSLWRRLLRCGGIKNLQAARPEQSKKMSPEHLLLFGSQLYFILTQPPYRRFPSTPEERELFYAKLSEMISKHVRKKKKVSPVDELKHLKLRVATWQGEKTKATKANASLDHTQYMEEI